MPTRRDVLSSPRRPRYALPYGSNVYFGTGRYGLGITDPRLRGDRTEDIVGPLFGLDPRLGFGSETSEGVGSLDFPEAPPAPSEAPHEPEAPEPWSAQMARQGVEALRARDYDAAAGLYAGLAAHDPEEPEHRRRLALALLGAGLVEDAGAAMLRAYTDAPELTWRPLDAPGLLGSASETRRMLNRAVTHANRTDDASVMLLSAVLMQSEGRETPALRMLERIKKSGVDEVFVSMLKDAMGG